MKYVLVLVFMGLMHFVFAQTDSTVIVKDSVITGVNDTIPRVHVIRVSKFRLTEKAKSRKYGSSEDNPVKLGGGDNPSNLMDYLNNLKGPKGQKVEFKRLGSGEKYNDPDPKLSKWGVGVTTIYKVWYKGKKPVIVYFDRYRYDTPKIIKGFTWSI